MTGNLKIISDSRTRYKVSKGSEYRFPSRIDLKKCREELASALNDFDNPHPTKALFSRSLREQKFSNENFRGENSARFLVSSRRPFFFSARFHGETQRDFAEKLRENSQRNSANFRGVSARDFA